MCFVVYGDKMGKILLLYCCQSCAGFVLTFGYKLREGTFLIFGALSLTVKGSSFCLHLFCILPFLFQHFSVCCSWTVHGLVSWCRKSLCCRSTFIVSMYDLLVCLSWNQRQFKSHPSTPSWLIVMRWECHPNWLRIQWTKGRKTSKQGGVVVLVMPVVIPCVAILIH